MSVSPGVDVFFNDLLHDDENGADSDDVSGDGQDSFVDDDASIFSTETIDSAEEHDIYGNPAGRPTDEEALGAVEEGGQNEVDIPPVDAEDAEILPPPPITENVQSTPEMGAAITPKERSIAHHPIVNGKVAYLSFDIETAGEYAGIVQMSGEIFRLALEQGGKSKRKDTATSVRREVDTFNKYVNPGSGAIWSEQ